VSIENRVRNKVIVPGETASMNALLARCAHLFPAWPPSWAALPLRLIVGFGFLQHGYAKLARGADNFVGIVHALHVPMPFMMAWITILVEVICGAMVLAGFFIPLASLPMAIVLLVAIFTVHLPNGFSSIKLQAVTDAGARFGQPGYETDLLYLAAILALVILGSGQFALDRALLKRLPRNFF